MFNYIRAHKKSLVYTPLVIYWIILFIATSLPSPDLPDIGGSDKLKHFTAYMILALLINLALLVQKKYKMSVKKGAVFTLITCVLYGALDELHQTLIPGRSAELLDLVADTMGTITGILIVLYMVRKNSYTHTEVF